MSRKKRLQISFMSKALSIILAVSMLFPGFASSPVQAADNADLDAFKFTFEEGNFHGFQAGGGTALSIDAATKYAGESSMKIAYSGDGMKEIWTGGIPANISGLTISFQVFVPSGTSLSLQPYLNGEGGWRGVWYDNGGLEKGAWNEIAITVPANYPTANGATLGVQIFPGGSQSTAIWLDELQIGSNKKMLERRINEAIEVLEASVTGSGKGQYTEGAQHTMSDAIEAAELVLGNPLAAQPAVDQALNDIEVATAAFEASKVTAPENIKVYYNNVINDIKHDFWGVNYVAFWDNAQGSPGSMNALRRADIDYIRFPGGVPGNWYDWSNPYRDSLTSPVQLRDFAQGADAGILWQTNPTTNGGNDPGAEHLQDMMDHFAEEGIQVNYYEIGNEIDLELIENHEPREESYMEYIDSFVEQAAAVHEKDPGAFVLGPSGTNEWYWWGLDLLGMFLEETEKKDAIDELNGVSLHWYGAYEEGWDYAKGLASRWYDPEAPLNMEDPTDTTKPMNYIKNTLAKYGHSDLPVFMTETSATYTFQSDATAENARLSGALATADMLGAYRNSGVQSVALFGAIHGGDNNWGILYGQNETRPLDTPTPIYFTLPIWTKSGDQVLEATGMSDVVDGVVSYASKKEDGSAQVVLINKDAAPTDVAVSFDGFDVTGADVDIYELKSSNGSHHTMDVVYNGELMPSPATEDLPEPLSDVSEGSVYTRTVPGYSMTLLDFKGGAETASSDTRLRSLHVNGEQAQASSKNKLSYKANVPNNSTSATVTVVPVDPWASYEVIVADELAVGPNQATVIVTAEDGTAETYALTINRAGALQDLWILKDYKEGQWSGGAVENANGELPFDESQVYDGLPSYRINVQGNDGWWTSLLAKNGWSTYNILPYYENGYLEFNVKGGAGGETFKVGVRSRQYGHDPEEVTQNVNLADYATVTTEWQKVKIPIKDIIDPASGFDMKQMWVLVLDPANSSKFKVWINSIKFTSEDEETEFPAIKVNQLGYLTNAEKYALVTGSPSRLAYEEGDSFRLKRISDGEVVMTGELTLVSEYEPVVSGEKILKANFGEWKEAGEYVIEAGEGEAAQTSPTFKIGTDLYNDLLKDSARYFYYQRAGMALEEEYAGQWNRPLGHPQDTAVRLESQLGDPDAERRDFSGGWYDAGDYGKYTNAGATAVSDLLWAYEMFPSQFPDNHLHIPESGNDIPDVLDEARYELDLLIKMQDQASGGFYHRIYPQGGCEDASVCMPHQSNEERYVSDMAGGLTNVRPTGHTASAVGVLAHASIVYDAFDEPYSEKLLQTAEAGWQYLADNPEPIVSPEGPYYSDDDELDRFYAAAALFRATGEQEYHDYVLAHYADFAEIFSQSENAHGVGNLAPIAYLHYMLMPNREAKVEAWYREHFEQWKAVQLARSDRQAWMNTLDDGTDNAKDGESDYYWGSNMPLLNTSLTLAIGSQLLGTYNEEIRDVALRNLNYLLGVNPLRFSYVSGYGEDSVQNIYSGIYSSDGIDAIPPGYMAGGPNIFQGAHFSLFAGKAYNDVDTEWTTNEHTIYWNSTLVFSAAFASANPELQPVEIVRQDAGGNVAPPPGSRATIPAGQSGTVSMGNKASVFVPAGASDQELHLSIEELLNTTGLIDEDDKLLSPIFELLKNRAGNFLVPVKLTFAFDAGAIGDDEKPSIFYYDEDRKVWVEIGGTAEGNRITAEVDHFTKFAVFAVAKVVKEERERSLSDIAGHWAEARIKAALKAGIVNGFPDGTFRPEAQVTRAQFTVMLMNALGADDEGATLAFSDSGQIGPWAELAVAQAVAAGVVNGYEDGSFRPDAAITRAQMAVMIARALELAADSGAATSFADDADIPAWAKGAAEAAKERGIIQGRGGNRFVPNANATRAEAIEVIMKAVQPL